MTNFMRKIVENKDGAVLVSPEELYVRTILRDNTPGKYISKGMASLGMPAPEVNEEKAIALLSQLKVAKLKAPQNEKEILCMLKDEDKTFLFSFKKTASSDKFSFGVKIGDTIYPYQGKKMEEIFLLAAVSAAKIEAETGCLDYEIERFEKILSGKEMEGEDYGNFIRMVSAIQKGKQVDITSADDLSVISLKKLKINKIVVGDMDDFSYLEGKKDLDFLKTGVYHLRNDLSDFEKNLIPTIPDWYVMPEEVGRVAKLIKNIPNMRNVAFKGESSTGKTEASRALAAALGIPYVSFTCGENMDEYDLIGQPTPYTFVDENGEEKTEIRFVETDLIKAIRNGWLVEIQEPNVARQQGVFVKLNGLMDRDGKITLSNGEVVERHPDSVMVMTMNEGYVSTRPMNQAVLRRLGTIMKFELPSVNTLMERLKLLTGVDNRRILSLVVESGQKIISLLKENGLDDGTCGTADLRDWLNIAKIEGSLLDAAEISIIQKATSDEDTKEAIRMYLESKVTSEDEEAMAEIAG